MAKENCSTIITPETTHIIKYGAHIFRVSPVEFPKRRFTGWAFETGSMANYVRETSEVFQTYRNCRQYRQVFDWLERKKTPAFFCDTEFGVKNSLLIALLESSESTMRLGTIASTVAAVAAKALGLLTHRGEDFIAGMKMLPDLFKEERVFWTLKLRNILWAHKLQWLGTQLEGHQTFGSILGPHHNGVEQEIVKSSDERLSYLDRTKFAWRPIISPDVFPIIQRYDYNPKLRIWQPSTRYEVLELKELLGNTH